MQRPACCRRCQKGPLVGGRAPEHIPGIRHKGRGLCPTCYNLLWENRQLHLYPTINAPIADHRAVVIAYLELTGHGLSKTEIARQIGVGRAVMYAALAKDPRTRPAPQLTLAELARLRRAVQVSVPTDANVEG